ncbi:hypothetical protein K7X08_018471 [Anisodus acutangulus]|uniref:DUF7806 domain-containing protein n=1 Tax=Anisodus acutangulus TaxID=402998 RepID=A0A9Q1LVS0_9SOLA|nr:hypothetical protein K7X08_018471 [Anisodus acutangulus]
MIAFGDSLPDSDGSSIKLTRKHLRQSLLSLQDTVAPSPREELPTGAAQPNNILQPAFCRRNVNNSGDAATDICPGICIFQDLVHGKVGMGFSTVVENEELCISALHESSGFSFSLTWINNASKELELVYPFFVTGYFWESGP